MDTATTETEIAYELFLTNCQNGDIIGITTILSNGIFSDAQMLHGMCVACKYGHLRIVELLTTTYQIKDNPDILDEDHNTCTHIACIYNHPNICEYFGDFHFDTMNLKNLTPMHYVCMNGYIDIINVMREDLASAVQPYEDNKIPLLMAIEDNFHPQLVCAVLSHIKEDQEAGSYFDSIMDMIFSTATEEQIQIILSLRTLPLDMSYNFEIFSKSQRWHFIELAYRYGWIERKNLFGNIIQYGNIEIFQGAVAMIQEEDNARLQLQEYIRSTQFHWQFINAMMGQTIPQFDEISIEEYAFSLAVQYENYSLLEYIINIAYPNRMRQYSKKLLNIACEIKSFKMYTFLITHTEIDSEHMMYGNSSGFIEVCRNGSVDILQDYVNRTAIIPNAVYMKGLHDALSSAGQHNRYKSYQFLINTTDYRKKLFYSSIKPHHLRNFNPLFVEKFIKDAPNPIELAESLGSVIETNEFTADYHIWKHIIMGKNIHNVSVFINMCKDPKWYDTIYTWILVNPKIIFVHVDNNNTTVLKKMIQLGYAQLIEDIIRLGLRHIGYAKLLLPCIIATDSVRGYLSYIEKYPEGVFDRINWNTMLCVGGCCRVLTKIIERTGRQFLMTEDTRHKFPLHLLIQFTQTDLPPMIEGRKLPCIQIAFDYMIHSPRQNKRINGKECSITRMRIVRKSEYLMCSSQIPPEGANIEILNEIAQRDHYISFESWIRLNPVGRWICQSCRQPMHTAVYVNQ